MNIFLGFVALILMSIGVINMFADNWGPGAFFFIAGLVAIHFIDDGGRPRGFIGWFFD